VPKYGPGSRMKKTVEFEALDALLPYDGEWIWPDKSLPLLPMEKRWPRALE